MAVDLDFTRRLPKVELHAHLTGSITRECLHQIWLERLKEEPDLALEDPLIALPSGATNYDHISFYLSYSTLRILLKLIFPPPSFFSLLTTLPSLTHSTTSVLSSFAADGICYLELRTTPRSSPLYTKQQYVTTILDCITEHNSSQTSMRTKLILSVDRKHDASEVAETVDLAIRFRNRGVVGVDLCGSPARGIDVEMLRREFGRAKEAGLKLTIHFAEIPASASRVELAGLLAMGPERLGHVIHVPEDVREEIGRRKIGLEMCLSCNVHAKLTEGGFGGHHFGEWMGTKERGPVVLCLRSISIFGEKIYWICARKRVE
ncbi:MAG: hypothetical protein Q9188_002682 [Gyalolechia gomerana]